MVGVWFRFAPLLYGDRNMTRIELIRRARLLSENPYAYMDGEGHYDALLPADADDIHHRRRQLQNPWAYLDGSGAFAEVVGKSSDADTCVPVIATNKITGRRKRAGRYTKPEIAALVRKLQIELWSHRSRILDDVRSEHPEDVLDPIVALKALGFHVNVTETLGQYSDDGDQFEVAGIIDVPKRKANFSRNFSPQVRRFTAAHELGHAILHGGVGLHRDRAIDGTTIAGSRSVTEREADTFAALFLLPEKRVIAAFKGKFLECPFQLNEQTAFALMSQDIDSVRMKFRTLRDLTRILSSADYYNGVHFSSLSDQFGVSIEAMAIRLEELKLVQF